MDKTDKTPKKDGEQFRTPMWKAAFLAELAETGNVLAACRKAGVVRSTAYFARQRDEEFAENWDTALEDAADALEVEARRRAIGWNEEETRGETTRTTHRHSDNLLMFLLKGLRPEKYRDNHPASKTSETTQPTIAPDVAAAMVAAAIAASGETKGPTE